MNKIKIFYSYGHREIEVSNKSDVINFINFVNGKKNKDKVFHFNTEKGGICVPIWQILSVEYEMDREVPNDN